LPTYTGNLAGNQLTVTTVDAIDISTTDFATTDLTSYGYAALSNVNATGNITAGGILTDNYYYANGEPFVSSVPGGNNTQVQYNANGVFDGSPAFTFNDTANALTVSGNVIGQQLTATNGLVLNGRTITQDFELDGYNASSVGPITTAPGVVVDITDGNWVIS
jgi:hypothetical protein